MGTTLIQVLLRQLKAVVVVILLWDILEIW